MKPKSFYGDECLGIEGMLSSFVHKHRDMQLEPPIAVLLTEERAY